MASPTASHLRRDWRFDASSSSFVTNGASIRVLALPPGEAGLVDGAREQAEDLYCGLFQRAGRSAVRAKNAVAGSFHASTDPAEAAQPARTVLAYFDATPDAPSDRVAAYTHVVDDAECIIIFSIAVTPDEPEDAQRQVLHAIAAATEELALAMATNAIVARPGKPAMIWRGLVGASDYLKTLYEEDGYSTKLTDRLEMTAQVKDLNSAEVPIPETVVDGIEFRPLDLVNDDLVAVYNVLKLAFGSSPPSFAAWKRHYAQQPRFAEDLSCVAWRGNEPVAVSLIEFIVEGEGGGEDEVAKVYKTDEALDEESKCEALPVEFPPGYEERRQKIRATATTAYVCGIATVLEWRGKRLGQTLLRHNFQAAARAGLESVYLGTDRHNPAAVRAYTRAGMIETKAENRGLATAKIVHASP